MVERDVADDVDSALMLKFTVHLKVFEGLWPPEFALMLKSVALERLDFVEARLCDVEHEISRPDRVKDEDPTVTQLALKCDSTAGDALVWTPVNSEVITVGDSGKIPVHSAGTYLIVLEVVHRVEFSNACVALRKDDREVYRNGTPYAQETQTTTATTWALHVKAEEKFSVVETRVSARVGSKIVMMKIASFGA
jgi:hypothetical protein